MDSFFIVSDSGSVVLAKSYRGRVDRAVCEPFIQLIAAGSLRGNSSLPAVMALDRLNVLLQLRYERLFFVAVCSQEVPPLLVLELLDRIRDVLQKFCGPELLNAEVVKDHFTAVNLLLDEMLDFGVPNTVEPNILELLVNHPADLNTVVQSFVSKPTRLLKELAWSVVGGASSSQSSAQTAGSIASGGDGMGGGSGFGAGGGISGCGSDIWWRKGIVSNPTSSVHVDVMEKLSCTVDAKGKILHASVGGELRVSSHLAGLPEFTISVKDPSLLANAAFHHSVRLGKFNSDQVLVFVPPDGQFVLCNYSIQDGSASCPSSPLATSLSVLPPVTSSTVNALIPPANKITDSSSNATQPQMISVLGAPPAEGPLIAEARSLLPPVTVQGVLHHNQQIPQAAKVELRISPHASLRGASGSLAGADSSGNVPDMPEIDGVVVIVTLPSYVTSTGMSASHGSTKVTNASGIVGGAAAPGTPKYLVWSVGSMQADSQPRRLEGRFAFETDPVKLKAALSGGDVVVASEMRLRAKVEFVVKGWAASGMRVEALDVANVSGSPYKATRATTVSGRIEFRL